MEQYNALKKLFEFAYSDKISSYELMIDYLAQFKSSDIHVLSLIPNTVFIENTTKINYIYLLVKGSTYVVNYTVEGERIIADTLKEVQIFGLIEAINQYHYYNSTVITLDQCILVKIKKDYFLEAIYRDLRIAAYAIQYLAMFSNHTIKASEYKTTLSPRDKLIVYLYNKGIGQSFPISIKDNKSFIADSLQINKRTLYRYLNDLTQEQIITRNKQAILISKENFEKIKSLINTLNT
jgi:CRP-like cAMP-binding protein